MRFWPTFFALMLGLSLGQANARVRVPAEALVATARDAVQARARAEGLDVRITSVGHLASITLPDAGEPALQPAVPVQWLRSRLPVPVSVHLGDRKVASAVVWLELSARVPGHAYGAGAAKGALAEDIVLQTASIDLARMRDRIGATPASIQGLRLRRAVRVGEPLQASDFEPVPTVAARSVVRLESVSGAVRVSTPSRALADGEPGQVISVLPDHAAQPVRARVVSRQVVTVEK